MTSVETHHSLLVQKKTQKNSQKQTSIKELLIPFFLILLPVDLNRENTLLMTDPQLKQLTVPGKEWVHDLQVEKKLLLAHKGLKSQD